MATLIFLNRHTQRMVEFENDSFFFFFIGTGYFRSKRMNKVRHYLTVFEINALNLLKGTVIAK